jgi:hypothetical protein
MSRTRKRDLQQTDFELDDDYYDELTDDIDEFEDLAIDFYSTQVSARRLIERRNEFKEFYSELDDWGDYDSSDEW